jgi:hypothetical protein
MPSADFEKFLIRAGRHWTIRIIAECAGIGLLAGCGGALLLLPILLWRGEPGQTVAAILPTAGAIIGALAGLRRRPNLRQVAQLADVRLATADLLATAFALRGSTDPWDATILQMASAYSVGLSPALIVPYRLGRRAWWGILLAVVSVMTLGLFSITTTSNRAEAATASHASDHSSKWETVDSVARMPIQVGTPSAREARAETTPDSFSGPNSNAMTSDDQGTASPDHSTRDGGGATATGGGSARSDVANAMVQPKNTSTAAQYSANDGVPASAGDGHEVRSSAGQGTTAGQVETQGSQPVPPWSSNGWPAAQSAAFNAIQDGRVPDAYRNLVRDYFQPAAQSGESAKD